MERTRDASAAWRRVVLTGSVLFLAAVLPAKRHDPPRSPPYGVDKAAHAVGHAAFAVALVDAFGSADRSPGGPILAVFLSTGSGVLLEGLQRWVPGRRFEHGDVLAGAVGSVLGVSGVRLWRSASISGESRLASLVPSSRRRTTRVSR